MREGGGTRAAGRKTIALVGERRDRAGNGGSATKILLEHALYNNPAAYGTDVLPEQVDASVLEQTRMSVLRFTASLRA